MLQPGNRDKLRLWATRLVCRLYLFYLIENRSTTFQISVCLGTLGQPKIWDITNPVSYQHPMAPYDVLVDPQTVPNIPKKKGADELTSQDDTKDTDKGNEVSIW